MVDEVLPHAIEDRLGERGAPFRDAEQTLVHRTRDECGLHQHRGDIGAFEDHEAGLLDLRLAHRIDLSERSQHPLGSRHALGDLCTLREIDQHGGQRRIFVVQ